MDPFLFDPNSMDNSYLLKDDLIEIRSNARIQMEFEKIDLEQFWCGQFERYPELAKKSHYKYFYLSPPRICLKWDFRLFYTLKPKQEIVLMRVMIYAWLCQKRSLASKL